MDTFGEWLRQQRTQLRLTREQFSERVGCSVALLRKLEDGERRPSAQIAELLANCLNIPAAERSTFVRVARGELRVDRLAGAANTARTSPPSHTNLPVVPTPLIGRQREVAELSQLLCDPQCRLLTLVGPGGIGKTRLALETAAHTQDRFADGVCFVPFASVNSTRLMVPVIAAAIGFAFQSASAADPKTQLFGYLKQKQTLLVTDNLEQLLAEPGIELLTEVLAQAPQVKLLATSREILGVQAEWVFEVQGLPIPEGEEAQAGGQDTSVELFLQRARRAHVRFNATSEDYSAIVRICQLVEGMPLGLELAATWVRTLTCAEIAGELEHGLDFLSIAARDLPVRHRSMRAVFDHSWKLLSQDEQGILRRISVFRAGFRREAAEVVAGASLASLSALVMKSFIRRSGAGRYELHELLRQFAAEQLAHHPEEQTATQAAHAHYHLTFFGQADERLRSAAQYEVLAELNTEMDNFRTAWEWAVSHEEFALLEQTVRTFAIYYDMRGWFQEGVDTLGRAIALLETSHAQSPIAGINQLALGHMLTGRALLASRLGQHARAHIMLERSLAILRPLQKPRVEVEAIAVLGTVMELTGNYARALELYSEGLAMATTIGDRWFAALCFLCQSGLVGITQSLVTPEETHARLQTAVSKWRIIGDPRFTAIGLNNLSWSAMMLGEYEEARTTLEESVALNLSVGDRWGLSYAYRGLGLVAQTRGEHQQAVMSFRKGLDILNELGARQDVARLLAEMSRSVFALGDDGEAQHLLHQSLCIANETSGMFIALEALDGLATLRAKHGDLEQALELLLFVLHHPASLQETKQRAEQMQLEWEAQLTRQQVEAAHARAQSRTIEIIVNEVLKHTKFS